MRYEIESLDSRPQVKRVNIYPSSEDGYFIFNDLMYGLKAVGKVGLSGLDSRIIETLEAGECQIEDIFNPLDEDSYIVTPAANFSPIASISTGPDSEVKVVLTGFTEVVPVALRD